MSEIKRRDPISLLKEDFILDELDKQSRCKKYERRFLRKLSIEDIEGAIKVDNILAYVERPWEREADKISSGMRYTPEKLMQMYADRFPDELKQE